MTTGLPVSRIVNVSSIFSSQAAQAFNTNSLMIMGDSNVIGVGELSRTYTSAAGVAADFGANAPETLAAGLWFSVVPQPQSVQIGRWPRTATPALLIGGVITSANQAISRFNAITNGSLNITINGSANTLTALNFASQTNLNGVASVVTTALTGATCTWDGQKFTITTSATGAGTQASATATFTGNASNNDTITINGVAITFVTSGPTGNQVLIGTNAVSTVQNLLTFLQGSSVAGLTALTYSAASNVLTVTYPTVGTAGNAIPILKSSTSITLSGATLTGGVAAATISYATAGTGQDVATLLGLTSALASPPVAGVAAQTALQSVIALDNAAPYFFGLTVASPNIVDADHLAIAAYMEATNHIYGVSTQSVQTLSPTVTNDIASLLSAALYNHTFVSYSSFSPYSAAGWMGIALTIDFTQANTANTTMFKVLPGITPESLTTSQANTLTAKRCNYFVNYNNGTAITQNGVMCGTIYIDEQVGLSSLAFNIQNNEYNLLLQFPKIAQSNQGMALLSNSDGSTCAAYVTAGFLAPGIWGGTPFGALNTGDPLPNGYYVYRAPVVTQSTADRAARKAIPAQIAVKLAGAVHSSNVLINVNR